jgi:signal transduction histidine kinase
VRTSQVVANLLENAVQHTPAGGRVTASAKVVGTLIQVAIQDSGEGIPTEDLPNVFDRFYRVDPSRTRATGGTGLGLSIARQLIEAQGGNIRAESPPEGGALLAFTLPLD